MNEIKNKADKLVEKYHKEIQGHKYHYVNETAKQCALILCRDMINQLSVIHSDEPINLMRYIEEWIKILDYIENNY